VKVCRRLFCLCPSSVPVQSKHLTLSSMFANDPISEDALLSAQVFLEPGAPESIQSMPSTLLTHDLRACWHALQTASFPATSLVLQLGDGCILEASLYTARRQTRLSVQRKGPRPTSRKPSPCQIWRRLHSPPRVAVRPRSLEQ